MNEYLMMVKELNNKIGYEKDEMIEKNEKKEGKKMKEEEMKIGFV
jgi:fumarate hydratase class II